MKKIYYLAHYDNLNRSNIRNVSPAAVSLVNYVINKLSKAGYRTEIISFAIPNKRGKFVYGSEVMSDFRASLKLFRYKYSNIKIIRLIKKIIFVIKTSLYTLFKIRKNSTVIIYHSLNFKILPLILKKIKKVKIIYQIMEIYGDVTNNLKTKKKEIANFKVGDSFILINDYMRKYVKSDKIIVIYGSYEIIKKPKKVKEDNVIDCVYSGTFNKTKGGVFNAIKAFRNLDDSFRLHILGFGNQNEVSDLKNFIKENNVNNNLYFHGLLLGEDFINFLSNCDIGLALQNPSAKYNETSFPSKIITYMSNGLQVVSSNVSVVKKSKIASSIFFTYNETAKEMAEVIVEASKNKKDVVSKILELDAKFTSDFLKFI